MKISNFHLGIGVPCSFPFVPFSFMESWVYMDRPDFTFIPKTSGHIDDLRNDIVEEAQIRGVTHLIMQDVDMIYHPKTIPSLLAHNLPVVGALSFRRYPPFDGIMLRLRTEDGITGYESVDDWEDGEIVEVDATGTGCILFNMEVFKKIPYPWFQFYKEPTTGAVVGEDIGFCQKLKEAGYKIFVDTSVPSDHLTTMAVNRQTNLLYRAMKASQKKKAQAMGFNHLDKG